MKCIYCGQEIGLYDTICKCCGAPLTKQTEITEAVEEKHVEQSTEEDEEESVPEQVLQVGSSVVENKPNKTTKNVIITLLALLICCAGGYVLYNMTSSNSLDYADAEQIDPTDTIADATNITEEPNTEEQILQRAEYIFKNLPDHRMLDDIDKTVFSPSFLELLEKAFAIFDELEGEEAMAMDRLYYWYVGQDDSYDDGLQDISLLSKNDETAVVKVTYKNCGYLVEHKMRLVCSDRQWLCDNWDDMKEGLLEDMEMEGLSMETQTEEELPILEEDKSVVDSIRSQVDPGEE